MLKPMTTVNPIIKDQNPSKINHEPCAAISRLDIDPQKHLILTKNKEKKNGEGSTEHQVRRWVIIEDYPTKVELLIAHILDQFPDDEIHVLYGEKDPT
ncbi:MAG: hypothetical protein AAF985_25715, partial [Bacteroidota bacterium]